MSTAKKEFEQSMRDMVADGLTDVQIAETIGCRSAAEVRRIKHVLGIDKMKLWKCANCGFKMLSHTQPKCRRHSIHCVPFSDYEKSNREDGLLMLEVDWILGGER